MSTMGTCAQLAAAVKNWLTYLLSADKGIQVKPILIYDPDGSINHELTGHKMKLAIGEALQSDVAKRMGISPQYLSDLLLGRRNWTERRALVFMEALK